MKFSGRSVAGQDTFAFRSHENDFSKREKRSLALRYAQGQRRKAKYPLYCTGSAGGGKMPSAVAVVSGVAKGVGLGFGFTSCGIICTVAHTSRGDTRVTPGGKT